MLETLSMLIDTFSCVLVLQQPIESCSTQGLSTAIEEFPIILHQRLSLNSNPGLPYDAAATL